MRSMVEGVLGFPQGRRFDAGGPFAPDPRASFVSLPLEGRDQGWGLGCWQGARTHPHPTPSGPPSPQGGGRPWGGPSAGVAGLDGPAPQKGEAWHRGRSVANDVARIRRNRRKAPPRPALRAWAGIGRQAGTQHLLIRLAALWSSRVFRRSSDTQYQAPDRNAYGNSTHRPYGSSCSSVGLRKCFRGPKQW